MDILAWVLQALMAALFLVHGALMVVPPEAIMRRMRARGREPSFSPGLRIFVGLAEVAAGAGLILPGLVGVLTFLTPLAAVGLTVVMAGATVYHLQRREGSTVTVVLGVVCLAIAVLRWTVAPL